MTIKEMTEYQKDSRLMGEGYAKMQNFAEQVRKVRDLALSQFSKVDMWKFFKEKKPIHFYVEEESTIRASYGLGNGVTISDSNEARELEKMRKALFPEYCSKFDYFIVPEYALDLVKVQLDFYYLNHLSEYPDYSKWYETYKEFASEIVKIFKNAKYHYSEISDKGEGENKIISVTVFFK